MDYFDFMAFMVCRSEFSSHVLNCSELRPYLSFSPGPHSKLISKLIWICTACLFVCVEVLRPSQPNGVMSSVVSLPNHTFTGQA